MAHRNPALAPAFASFAVGAALVAATGCGSAVPASGDGGGDLGAVVQSEFPMCNEVMLFKSSRNGICQNGLSVAGLTETGLGLEGLATEAFASWFDGNPAGHDILMRYLVKCAAPASAEVEWESPNSEIRYRWAGGLGLATEWASGHRMTEAEQQLLSACLAAHVNKYGQSVPLSVQGRAASGDAIALDPGELDTFSVREGCFFGNLFAGEPVMVGLDHPQYAASVSSVRACALAPQEEGTTSLACPPMVYAGTCEALCVPTEDPLTPGLFYESCTYGDKTYLPVNTRLRPEDIFSCGDGICEITESCGDGSTPESCLADCGPCP
jgi:hypothetical protein